MQERIREILDEAVAVQQKLPELVPSMERAARMVVEAFRAGRSLYVMGNGGSAADAQHLAGELVGRFLAERDALPCHALSTDTSVLTALANDYGVDQLFARQVAAFVGQGDVVMGISTSGNSADVNAAIREARARGARTIGLAGRDGGELAGLCDLAIVVPSESTPRIQEAHGTIVHIICQLVEESMFPRSD